jgi:hypothetical protein
MGFGLGGRFAQPNACAKGRHSHEFSIGSDFYETVLADCHKHASDAGIPSAVAAIFAA